jgi:UDP-N-acetylmuramoyl-tripeptide--D-alanyl-D-alanine ligase
VHLPELYQLYLQYPSIQTDTRKVQKGDIFFALKGPYFNGNLFAEKALELGAAYAVIDEAPKENNPRLILVDDVLQTLQDLAGYHRLQFQIPFIAITGSNGKTTTKELVAAVLSSHYKTSTTIGNLNNHIGVPLTLLKIQLDTEMAVIEMGANHQKEIESYCQYTQPTHGIITNCGKAHLEGFGGVEGIRKGKGELFDCIRAHQGTVIRYSDDNYLKEMSVGIEPIFEYGTASGDIIGQALSSEPFLEINISKGLETALVKTQLVGDYNLPNVLCAIAVGKFFQVPDDKIIVAIENYTPTNSRSQLMHLGSNQLILDAYNANPSSMKLAIENFAHLKASNKILMLGAMMELGVDSVIEHQEIISLIKKYSWDQVVLVGGDFANTTHDFIYFPDSDAAKDWFQQQQFTNRYLLIKGSRSMQMEKIIAG